MAAMVNDEGSCRAVTAAIRYEVFNDEDIFYHEGHRWVKFDVLHACRRRFSSQTKLNLRARMEEDLNRRGRPRVLFHNDDEGVLWAACPKVRH